MSFHNNKLKKLIIAAMFGAIICVVTMVVKIPLPLGGYVHLGDAFTVELRQESAQCLRMFLLDMSFIRTV